MPTIKLELLDDEAVPVKVPGEKIKFVTVKNPLGTVLFERVPERDVPPYIRDYTVVGLRRFDIRAVNTKEIAVYDRLFQVEGCLTVEAI